MKEVTLNPHYSIRNEKGCSYILTNVNFSRRNNQPNVIEIPPLYGYILSQFIEGFYYDQIIEGLSQNIGIEEIILRRFIEKLVDNPNPFVIKLKDENIFLPQQLLITGSFKSKVVTSGDFNYADRFIKSRPQIPFLLNLMFTSKCKTDCIYCYADRSRKDDMDLPSIKKIIREAYINNVVNIQISGGDIFAYPNWKLVFNELKIFGYKPFLSTKVPLTEQDILFLIECGFDSLQFSLDSLNPYLINKIVKKGNGYVESVLDMLKYASKHQFKIDIKSVLMPINGTLDNIHQMQSILSEFSCISSWNLMPVFYSSHKKELENKSDNIFYLKGIYEYVTNNTFPFIIKCNALEKAVKMDSVLYKSKKEFLEENKGCAANSYAMSILSNGKVSICEMLYYNKKFYIGDIKNQSLEDIWNSKEALALYYHNKQPKDSNRESPCYTCEDLKKCRQSYIKKVCYVDIINAFNDKWDYPDPRCPKAPIHDVKKIMTL